MTSSWGAYGAMLRTSMVHQVIRACMILVCQFVSRPARRVVRRERKAYAVARLAKGTAALLVCGRLGDEGDGYVLALAITHHLEGDLVAHRAFAYLGDE